jgi:Fe-S cluster biogenesis protein NfuA
MDDQIRNLIAERVQPFVHQDGGDIEYISFDEKSGVVQVKMHGACKGCPKSMVTLKLGIERMLKHYIPDVVAVEDIGTPLSDISDGDKEKAKEFGP